MNNNLQDRELIVTRLVNAPQSLVWKAFTDPDHLPRWWGPQEFFCDTTEIDIRPGGTWRFMMKNAAGVAFKNRLTFHEFKPETMITYTIDDDGVGETLPFECSATFEAKDDSTLVTLRTVFDSVETRVAMEKFGAVEGGQSTLRCLEHYLKQQLEQQLQQHESRQPHGDNDLCITRIINAPRQLVWRAMTEPQHVVNWFIPAPMKMKIIEMSLQPGGALRTQMSEDDKTYSTHLDACFLEVVAGERFAFTTLLSGGWRPAEPWLAVTAIMALEDLGDKTRYIGRALHKNKLESDKHVELGFYDGWGTCAEQLKIVAETMPRT